MATDFVHLHLHTDYSLLDGASAISWHKLKKEDLVGKTDIVAMAHEYGMKAVAITDHGVMGGCLEFHNELKKEGIKPIIGCEAYIAPGSRFDKRVEIPHVKGYHLILLAKNQTGYRNLCKLISEANVNGFYYKPRIDHELLEQYSEGLIGMSACLNGEIDVELLTKGYAGGRASLDRYVNTFAKGDFYLELMDHGIEAQKRVNRDLIKLSRETGVKLVATNDVHYLKKEHARSHEIMLCIQTRTTMSDTRRMKMDFDEFYFKSGDEMASIFGNEVPEAITNTLEVAEKCDVTIGYENHYPEYTPPEAFISTLDMASIRVESASEIAKENAAAAEKNPEKTPPTPEQTENLIERRVIMKKAAAYLRRICLYGTGEETVCGYKRKYGYDPFNPPEEKKAELATNLKRMDYELSIIERTKYPSYFLCVWDFINWAQEHGIPVGPGRGSGAGSIVAYLSGITNIDPMKYDLLFERFLNPDRISPPDFDTDFCERRRQEVIDYVIKKYGFDSVSQIGTYGTLKAKAVLKDVARALDRPPSDGNMITKTVPDDPKMTLARAINESPDLQNLLKTEPWVKEIFEKAQPLEQLNRQMGIHACGVIICNQPLADLVPLGRGAHDEVITQYVAPLCESVGLLKMDFLGLRTLTVIQDACDNVRKSRGVTLDMDNIPLDDPATFKLLNSGDTVAVFQLESGGMQELCRKFGVETIKHIIALVAIYRPGPMQFIDLFVGRKRGTIPVEYDHPLMEKYLKETYGIMLYQEQIMQVVQALAGFSLGQADILRRAIGKKKIKDMEAQHDKFVEGCGKANSIPPELAEKIWENIKKFADYGFNKSHSAAYAILSYRTAYLKANYRAEFMAAVLTSELSNAEKITFLINECRSAGIKILPPDINSSDVNFTVDNGSIRFGLGAIKGFGAGASRSIISARENGPFTDLTDLLERTEGINSKALESLIRCGALDSTGIKRSQLMFMIDGALKAAAVRKKERESGQATLFDMLCEEDQGSFDSVDIPDIPEFAEAEILENEKALLGFYVSGHPLSKYSRLISSYSSASVSDILEMPNDIGVKLGGMITAIAKKYTKKDNKPFAILTLEDLTGNIEALCYNRIYEKCSSLLEDGAKVFVTGITKRADENSPVALTVESVIPLEEAGLYHTDEFHVHFSEDDFNPVKMKYLTQLIMNNRGSSPLILCVRLRNDTSVFIEASYDFSVGVTPALLEGIDNLLGVNHYKIKPTTDVPAPKPRWNKESSNNKEQK